MWECLLLLSIIGLVIPLYNLIRIYFADKFCKKILAMAFHWDVAFYENNKDVDYETFRNPFYKFLIEDRLLDDIMRRWWKPLSYWQDRLDKIVQENLKFTKD